MKKVCLVIVLIFSFTILLTTDISYDYDPDQLIRFHVLANSDSERDQALKYQVKDQVVSYMQGQFANSQSIEESREILVANMEEIANLAERTLQSEGSSDTVDVQYGRFDFPVKYYGDFSLPAGNYEAVRVVIGEGEGENWWCVLFPPLCFVDSGQGDSSQYSTSEPKKEIIISSRIGEWMAKWDSSEENIAHNIPQD